MRNLFILVIVSLLLSACGKSAIEQSVDNSKRYPIKGKVVSVDKAKKKVKLDHEEIPGYMEAMTMDFPVREDWVWEDMKPGGEIRAELVVDNAKGEYWLEKIAISAAVDPNNPALPADERFANIGKPIQEFSLTNQDNKKISTKDFAGKAWALTFIYRQCPLPEYCIKMSTNFSDANHKILADAALKDKIKLLTISFDPARDTPEKLREYGLGYLGKDAKPDFSVWQLAVGSDSEVKKIADYFGLRYETDAQDKTKINHSLRTAVIAPDGKVTKVFTGGDWSPDDLIAELKKTLPAQ